MLAGTEARMDWLRTAVARGAYLGMEAQIISVDEAERMLPLIDRSQFVGALWDPLDGHVDPAGVTNAFAKAATMGGAEINRKTMVSALRPMGDGSWEVVTDRGIVRAEHVVNAGGLWAREVGRMVGVELPVLAMEHQYLVTEEVADLLPTHELPHTIDFEGEIYLRQERQAILLGTYERNPTPWSPRVTPWDFGTDLLPPKLERIAANLAVGFRHFPKLAGVGIRRVINGPFTFAPDGNPLVGPVRGLRNFWVACGVMAGFSQGGGVGLALANWMVTGDAGMDVWAMDVARYGDWTTPAYTSLKVRENYSRRFRTSFPGEELPAGRPLRTSPIHARQVAAGAVFGAAFGLEVPLWYGPDDTAEQPGFRRSNAHPYVAAECAAVRTAVGLIETTATARYEFRGPTAEAFLNEMMTNRMPQPGRIVRAPMLNHDGKLIGDFTVARLGDELFHVFGSGPAEQYHLRWWEARTRAEGTAIRSLRSELAGLSIAGPNARALLAAATGEDVSNDAFPFMRYRRMALGTIPATVGRLSFTGDLGYEIWVASDLLAGLHTLLSELGADLGLRPVGTRAVNALRLEKGWGTWAREYRPTCSPFEAGLDRFVSDRKDRFVGRDAALRARGDENALRLVTFALADGDADALGDEPVRLEGQAAGWVTSGGYAHWSGRSVAMAYLPARLALPGTPFTIDVLGASRTATLLTEPLFDPAGLRLRG
jgi:dimethylglycine dehydrogenase